jgi:hypothetical protein
MFSGSTESRLSSLSFHQIARLAPSTLPGCKRPVILISFHGPRETLRAASRPLVNHIPTFRNRPKMICGKFAGVFTKSGVFRIPEVTGAKSGYD